MAVPGLEHDRLGAIAWSRGHLRGRGYLGWGTTGLGSPDPEPGYPPALERRWGEGAVEVPFVIDVSGDGGTGASPRCYTLIIPVVESARREASWASSFSSGDCDQVPCLGHW